MSEPPFLSAEAVILVAESPDRPSFHTDSVPLSFPPELVLGPEARVWALGFGCPLDRLRLNELDICPRDRGDALLPVPPEVLVWTEALNWVTGSVQDAPECIRNLLPLNGIEPCRTFSVDATIDVSSPVPNLGNLADEEDGRELLQVVADGRGGILALQQVLGIRQETRIRRRGRYLSATETSPVFEPLPVDETLPDLALASRGGTELVLAGEQGIVVGNFKDGFSEPIPAPPLKGAFLGRIAVSPADTALEVFTLSLDNAIFPGTSSLTLARFTPDGFDVLLRRPFSNERDLVDVPEIVWIRPGEAWATGFRSDGQIAKVSGSTVTFDSTGGSKPIRMFHREGIGTILTDRFRRNYFHPPGQGWISLGAFPGIQGAIDMAVFDGTLVIAAYQRRAGVRFVYIRQPLGSTLPCFLDPPLPIEPARNDTFSSGLVAGVATRADVWWFASGVEDRVLLDRVILPEAPGACGRPPDEGPERP